MTAPAGIECHDLTKAYDGVHAVEAVRAAFHSGQVAAVIGPNGAGKTTLFHLLAGMARPDRGQVFLKGRNVTGLPSWRIAAQGLGRLFQDVRVFGATTVIDNVLVAIPRQTGEDPWPALWQWRRIAAERPSHEARALELLARVGLEAQAERLASDLSFGQQKLLAFARLLASDADVLLLDEPTAGIARGTRERLLALLRDLARNGKTVVVIEHDLLAVRAVADVVFVMRQGRIHGVGSVDRMLGQAALGSAYFDVGRE